ncbi:MAG: glycerophosphoryl diester phosphodiesterase membrane domain-containing protein [Candidatus Kerfeldbacteria bacterium]|nr:glycerophosphoryl diester phosphodiesterase membrane domain-containing protein [Candidatus Kerfeldbacteria bacterium]
MATPTIDSSSAISYGWNAVKKDFWYLVGIAAVSQIISGLMSRPDQNPNSWDFLGIFLSAWMTAGYMVLMLSYQAGKKLPFTDLFTQLKYFWRVLGGTILVGLIVGAGTILFIIPGIYFALRFQFVIPLIIDKNLGIGAAMTESTRLTQGIKMSLLMFDLTLLGIIILGVICLGVGVFVALPVTWLAMVVVYRKLNQPAVPV